MNISKHLGLILSLIAIIACNQLIPTSRKTQEPVSLPSATTTPSATPNPTPITIKFYFTLAYNTNCRKGPSQVFPIITTISKNTMVEIVGRNFDGSWLYVIWDGQLVNCWVSIVTGAVIGNSPGSPSENNSESQEASQESNNNDPSPENNDDLQPGDGIGDWRNQIPIVPSDDPALKYPPPRPPKDPGNPHEIIPTATYSGYGPPPLPFPSFVPPVLP